MNIFLSLTWKFDGNSKSDILNFVFMNVVILVILKLLMNLVAKVKKDFVAYYFKCLFKIEIYIFLTFILHFLFYDNHALT